MKYVYIIPENRGSPQQARYQQISEFFKERHIQPIPVGITWRHRTMSDYIDEFSQQRSQNQLRGDYYLFGFSYGAYIAFVSSTKIAPKAQILCSLSPYFREDLPHLSEQSKQHVGKRRIRDFENYSFDELVGRVNCKTYLVLGTEELDIVKRRVEDAHKKIKGSTLVLSQGAEHRLAQPEYLKTVKEIISDL